MENYAAVQYFAPPEQCIDCEGKKDNFRGRKAEPF